VPQAAAAVVVHFGLEHPETPSPARGRGSADQDAPGEAPDGPCAGRGRSAASTVLH